MDIVFMLGVILVAALAYIIVFFTALRRQKKTLLRAIVVNVLLVVSIIALICSTLILALYFENRQACDAMREGRKKPGTSCFG